MTKKLTFGYVLMAGTVLATLAVQPQAGVHAADEAATTTSTAAATTAKQADTDTATADADTTEQADAETKSTDTDTAEKTSAETAADDADTTKQADTDTATTKDAAKTTTTSTVPDGQTVKVTGKTDTISTAKADTMDYQNVGEHSKVMVSQQYDTDGKKLNTYKASVVNRDAFTGDDAPQSDEGVERLDAQTIMDGDTTHYGEYVDGSWQVNSLTMNGGQKVADRKSFDLDVTAVVDGSEVTHDFTVADGVKVEVGQSEASQELNDEYGNISVTGTYLTVSVYGKNVFDDNYQGKVGDPDTIGELGKGFVNVPFTFHYYNAAGDLLTGTLNFINGTKVTTPVTTDDDKATSTPAADSDKDTKTPVKTPAATADDGETTPVKTTAKTTPAKNEQTPVTKQATATTDSAAKATNLLQSGKTANKTIARQSALPQAGNKESGLSFIGLALLALLGVGATATTRKRKA